MTKLTPPQAREILRRAHIPAIDFHALDSAAVDRLLIEADAVKYRKPRNANGSRARYFHAYLTRTASRKES